jgi:3-hydroxyacyl-[acyl-carrier-protein] dehydratase
MLQNDFYTVENLHYGEGVISCSIRFNSAHEIFRGHFPGQPVVPGVCMMQIVKELVEQQAGSAFLVSAAPQVKFLQLILPDTEPEVTISWQEKEEGGKAVNAVFKAGDAALFKMSATFV